MNWDWFYSLYSIAFMFLIFGFIWKVSMIPISLIAILFNDYVQKWILRLFMFVPYYFLASYSAFVGLYVNDGERSALILTVGGVFLFLHGGMGIVQSQREMEREGGYDYNNLIQYRYIGLLLGMLLYIYLLFDLSPAENVVIIKMAYIIDWIRNIPVLNWFMAVGSFFYVLYAIFICIAALIGLTFSAFNRNQ